MTTSRNALSAEFARFMHQGVRSLAHLGYRATRFQNMLANDDAVTVASRLVLAPPADGLYTLQQMGRLDMSVEMWVLHPRYETLFSQSIRDEAHRKLRLLDFDVERELRRLSEAADRESRS